jgi:fumarate reductase subunit C
VSVTPGYTPYHPRWLRPRVSTYWWLSSGSYLAFILREISSVFVAWFVVYLLMLVSAVSDGPAAYQDFLRWSGRPLVLLLNAVTLVFVVFHAITWFNLAPQAMVIKMGKTRVPGILIAGSNYAGWFVVSAVLAWLLLGRG